MRVFKVKVFLTLAQGHLHIKIKTWNFSETSGLFLDHLSRRLIGELIVYKGIRRPSVRLSTFSNDISSEAVRPILFIFHI